MPAGNELAQRPGVGNETIECISLRKLQYVRRRSCVRSANVLVLERLCRPPQLAATLFPNGSPIPRPLLDKADIGLRGLNVSFGGKARILRTVRLCPLMTQSGQDIL